MTIAFLLLLSYLRNPLSDVRCLPALAAALTALGTLAISHPSLVMTGGGASTVYLAGSLLTGVGSGIVVVLWAELSASLGSQRTVNYSVAALLLAAGAQPGHQPAAHRRGADDRSLAPPDQHGVLRPLQRAQRAAAAARHDKTCALRAVPPMPV